MVPCGKTAMAGTVTVGSEEPTPIVIPPLGAGCESVTVTVELVPPVTVVGETLTLLIVSDTTIVTLVVTTEIPDVAVTVTDVAVPTEPAVTMKF